MRKKIRTKRPWWRRGRTWISVALRTLLAAAVAGPIVWLLAGMGGDASPPEDLDEPAPALHLPTTTGDQASLADHEGRHNVLLFFNEGLM